MPSGYSERSVKLSEDELDPHLGKSIDQPAQNGSERGMRPFELLDRLLQAFDQRSPVCLRMFLFMQRRSAAGTPEMMPHTVKSAVPRFKKKTSQRRSEFITVLRSTQAQI